jgi:hypothetical protein
MHDADVAQRENLSDSKSGLGSVYDCLFQHFDFYSLLTWSEGADA